MKHTLSIYERTVTRRGRKGRFGALCRCQSEMVFNLSKAGAERRLGEMNKGLRKPYSLRFFDLDTRKGRADLLEAMAENLRRGTALRVAKLDAMANEAIAENFIYD